MNPSLRQIRLLVPSLLVACTALETDTAPISIDPGTGPTSAVLLQGDFPDPSIVRVEDTYYMTHSHKDMANGLLVWRSEDLFHWEPISRALRRSMGSVAAPELIHNGGKYIIYFPAQRTNWAVTADSPEGPWSEPIDLEVRGIDPGHIATPEGKRYLHLNRGLAAELAGDGLSLLERPKPSYEGWEYPEDYVVECFCLESPKLLYRDGFYHMMSAQGGTVGPATSHMAVSARSRTPIGPWENSPHNPIVRTFHKAERWWSRGHGTLIDTPEGEWYVVYHAYEKGRRNFGRQTLIEPIEWTDDGWYRSSHPASEPFEPNVIRNYAVHSDDFDGDSLHLQWNITGVDTPNEVRLQDGRLIVPGRDDRLRVVHALASDYAYETEIEFEIGGGAEAGLMLFYNDSAYAGIGVQGNQLFVLLKGERSRMSQSVVDAQGVRFLRLRNDDNDLAAFYSTDGETWIKHPISADVSAYQHNILGDFTSLKVGPYIRGAGELSVERFGYSPLESD